jgi:hypothetical protein
MKTAKKAAATKKAIKFPKPNASEARLKQHFRARLDREFPKMDLREVLGDKIAYDLLQHAQLIAGSLDRATYQPAVCFVARQSVAVEMEGMKSDQSNLVGSTLEWDRHVRRQSKKGAR